MARADLLIALVRASAGGDQQLFKRALEALIAEERAKHHTVLAAHLTQYLLEKPRREPETSGANNGLHKYLLETIPVKTLGDLILTNAARVATMELLEEQRRSDLLRSYGMEPRNRVLLVGPPGNGKTTLAEGLAEGLMVPLFTVRYHAVIASFLGETGLRLGQMFDQIRTRRCVLFFDEFDAIAKERGDIHETGEIKRVVSSLLLEMDALPSHVLVIAATNHPELLDRAVWRRFQVRINLPKPGRREIALWAERLQERLKTKTPLIQFNLPGKLFGLCYAELEDFAQDILRKKILSQPGINPQLIIRDVMAQWEQRSAAKKMKRVPRDGY